MMVNDENILNEKRAWRNPEESALKSIKKISLYRPEELPLTAREMELLPNAIALVAGIVICAILMAYGCGRTDTRTDLSYQFIKTLGR